MEEFRGLLFMLWVRSYRTADQLNGRVYFPLSFLAASKEGAISAVVFRWHGAENWWRWGVDSYPVDDELSFPWGQVEQYQNALGFGWLDRPSYAVMRSTQTLPDGSTISVFGAASATLEGGGPIVPYWLLTILALFSGASPWLVERFSLRTLLIATTLVAVTLGLLQLLPNIHPH